MKHVNPSEADELMKRNVPYIDVRSTSEFADGHPAGALNIPLLEPDDRSGMMQPNPDFVRVVQATVTAGTPLLIGCQVGGRSMRAAQVLESAGYSDVSNVVGGFGGGRHPLTGAPEAGWVRSGLPVETGAGGDRGYDTLLERADRGE